MRVRRGQPGCCRCVACGGRLPNHVRAYCSRTCRAAAEGQRGQLSPAVLAARAAAVRASWSPRVERGRRMAAPPVVEREVRVGC